MALQKTAHLTDTEKEELLKKAQDHLKRAKKERDYHKEKIETAVTSSKTPSPRIGHYLYDFAQQVHYPFNAQQTGPEYFKTARKCGLFGVCNDGKREQVNYLIDEAQNPGKGADCVISPVDHYLETHSSKEEVIYLHADNCTAQNKNNAMMQYLVWRVMNGKHDSIELSFMSVGHTKFSPDRFFGLIKKVYRHSSVSTLAELVGIAERSTTKGQNIAQLIEAPGEERLIFRQWTAYSSQFFKAIPSISTYHNFTVKAGKPGTVFVREFSDSKEKEETILKAKVDTSLLKTSKPAATQSQD